MADCQNGVTGHVCHGLQFST